MLLIAEHIIKEEKNRAQDETEQQMEGRCPLSLCCAALCLRRSSLPAALCAFGVGHRCAAGCFAPFGRSVGRGGPEGGSGWGYGVPMGVRWGPKWGPDRGPRGLDLGSKWGLNRSLIYIRARVKNKTEGL